MEDLDLDVRRHSGAISTLQQLELVGRASKRVRRLSIINYSSPNSAALSPPAAAFTSLSSTSPASINATTTAPFSRLSRLRLDGAGLSGLDWSAAELLKLVSLLHAAPLQQLELWSASFYHLHHLSALSHLHCLRLVYDHASLDNVMPASLQRYFRPHSRDSRCASQEEVDSATLGELISDEQVRAEWQWEVEWKRGWRVSEYDTFEPEHIFDSGKNGREAFFDAVRQMSDQEARL